MEQPLAGGTANAGRVVRIGDEVARPWYPQTGSVTHFLDFLRAQGIDLVPKPLGIDDRGRQRLAFIEGDVPTAPYPVWAYDEGLLVDVADRQRELHRAAAQYVAPADAVWAVSAGDYFPAEAAGDLVCHNDLGMSNTVVDPDTLRVRGFVDFDYCRPVDRLFDIAVALRHWVPFGEHPAAPALDRVRRFGLASDVHELDHSQRARVVVLAIAFLEKARTNVRALADAGRPGFQALVANGYEATNLASQHWLREHAEALAATN